MTETEYAVDREETATAGRYVVHIAAGIEAEMTFRKTAPDTITIDHIGVPRDYRHEGLALKLVLRAIADARASGTKIVPLCSYVNAQFGRHPEWADLRA